MCALLIVYVIIKGIYRVTLPIKTHTNETHSLANLQDLIPTLAGIFVTSTNQSK